MDNPQSVRTYDDGGVIFRQGDTPDVVYVVRSGAVKIYRTQDGKDTTLGVLKAGDMFGEMAVVGNKPRSASAQASGATECAVFSMEQFRSTVGSPEVWALLEKMCDRIREVDDEVEKMHVESLNRQEAVSSIRLRRSYFE